METSTEYDVRLFAFFSIFQLYFHMTNAVASAVAPKYEKYQKTVHRTKHKIIYVNWMMPNNGREYGLQNIAALMQ